MDGDVGSVRQKSEKRRNAQVWPPKGWRCVVFVGSITTAIALAINCGLLGWTRTHYDLEHGIATTFTGSCKVAKRIKLWSHLGINALSTVLFAAGNSCMQCLVAPTRKEIDRAHNKRRWLDIGPHTWRNLRSISWGRLSIWTLLACSSIPLHLVYNSVVYDSIAVNTFSTVVATPDFLNGTTSNFTCVEYEYHDEWLLELRRRAPTYTRLEPIECMRIYSQPQGSYSHLIAITKDNGPGEVVYYDGLVGGADLLGSKWVCGSLDYDGYVACPMKELTADVTTNGWRLPGWGLSGIPKLAHTGLCDKNTLYTIDYCLAEPKQDACQIFVATPLLAVVIACNFIKLACFLVTLLGLRFSPLITIGDAVESFLDKRDKTTVGFGVLTASTISLWTSRREETLTKPWTVKKRRGFAAVSAYRWTLSNLIFLLSVVAGVVLLALSLRSLRSIKLDTSISGLASLGLGKPIPSTNINLDSIIGDSPLHYRMLVCVLIANTPQLIVSVLYLVYNDLLTRIRLAIEWSSFHSRKQPLRVSNPVGQQRSTPFLELPLTWTIPLLTLMICLHWMISESLFFSLFSYRYFDAITHDQGGPYTALEANLSYSPLAIMVSVIIGGVMLLGLWLCGVFFELPGEMPIVRSCSAAISAACHRPIWDINASVKELSYGSVKGRSSNQMEHVTFCSGETRPLRNGGIYA